MAQYKIITDGDDYKVQRRYLFIWVTEKCAENQACDFVDCVFAKKSDALGYIVKKNKKALVRRWTTVYKS